MTGDTQTRKKASAIFFSVIMVVSMVGLGVGGLAGSTAALDDGGTNVALGNAAANADTTHTWTTETDEEETDEDVQGLVLDYRDSGTDLSSVGSDDVTVTVDDTEEDIAEFNQVDNELRIELQDPIDDPSPGTEIDVVVNNVINPEADGVSDVTIETHGTSFGANPTDDVLGSATTTLNVGDVDGPLFQIDDFNASTSILAQGDTLDTDVTVTNNGNETGDVTVDVESDNGGSLTIGNETVEDLDPGETATVSFDDVEIDVTPDEYTLTAEATNEDADEVDDTATLDLTVTDPDNNAFITGDIRDQFGDQIDNASEIDINIIDTDAEEVIATVNTDDEFTQEVPVQAPGGTNYTVSVDGDQAEAATGTEFESFARTATVDPESTERFDVRLRSVVNVDFFEVEQSADSVPADGESTIEFTVTAFGDDDENDPFEGADFEVTTDGDDITFDPDEDTYTTDEDGQFTVEVSSDVVQSADFTFEEQSQGLTETRTKSFTALDGEGVFLGQVKDFDTAMPLEGATLYAVEESFFASNAQDISVDDEFDDDEGVFRVVDDDTDDVVDQNDYDIQNVNSSDHVRVDQLNADDAGVGSGFTGTPNDGGFNYTITPIEAGNYTVQFSNVTDDPVGDDFTDVTTFEAEEDLTADAVAERAEDNDANPVAQTNEDGQATLTNLAADGKQGVDYVVIADRVDYTTKYSVENITSFDSSGAETEKTFLLEEREIQPDNVDIVQFGTHPPLSETDGEPDVDQITEFDDQSDDTFQEVPRDGTVDVIQVSSSASDFGGEEVAVDTEVEVTLEDDFDGAFLDTVVEGELVENDEENTTIVVETGADGEAFVLLETVQNSSNLNTQKTATLTEDTSVTDSSNVTFVGTVVYETTGSISGIVTNENNEPLPNSVVWTEEFTDDGGNTFEIEPEEPIEGTDRASVLESNFTITDVTEDETATVTGADLARSEGGYDFADFDRITLNGTDTVTLLTFPSEADGQAQYTLPRVPATDDGVDYSTVRGVQLESGEEGAGSADNVRPGFTVEGNVVIVGAEPEAANFQLSGLDPAEETIEEGTEEVTFSAVVTNDGNIPAEQDVTAFVALDGEDLVTSTETVSLGAGEADVVEATFDTSDLDANEYNHGFMTDDDSIEGTLTIEEADDGNGNDSSPLSEYANEDGVIESDGLQDAFADWQAGEIDFGTLQDAFAAWQSGEPVE